MTTAEAYFAEWLNEAYEDDVTIAGHTFGGHGDMLYKLDPVAFREAFLDWLDGMADDFQQEVRQLAPEFLADEDERGELDDESLAALEAELEKALEAEDDWGEYIGEDGFDAALWLDEFEARRLYNV